MSGRTAAAAYFFKKAGVDGLSSNVQQKFSMAYMAGCVIDLYQVPGHSLPGASPDIDIPIHQPFDE